MARMIEVRWFEAGSPGVLFLVHSGRLGSAKAAYFSSNRTYVAFDSPALPGAAPPGTMAALPMSDMCDQPVICSFRCTRWKNYCNETLVEVPESPVTQLSVGGYSPMISAEFTGDDLVDLLVLDRALASSCALLLEAASNGSLLASAAVAGLPCRVASVYGAAGRFAGDLVRSSAFDLLLSSLDDPSTQQWTNNGTGAFSNATAALPSALRSVSFSDASVADVDADGFDDVAWVASAPAQSGVLLSSSGLHLGVGVQPPGGAVAMRPQPGQPGTVFTIGAATSGSDVSLLITLLGQAPRDITSEDIPNPDLPMAANLPAVAFADYDADGLVDFAIASLVDNVRAFDIMKQRDDGSYAQVKSLTSFVNGGVVWGNFSGSPNLDLFVTGSDGVNPFPTLGARFFVDSNADDIVARFPPSWEPLYHAGATGIDYDRDGALDLYVAGMNQSNVLRRFVLRNLGNGTFEDRSDVLGPSVFSSGFSENMGTDATLMTFAGAPTLVEVLAQVTSLWSVLPNGSLAQTPIPELHLKPCHGNDVDHDGLDDLTCQRTTGSVDLYFQLANASLAPPVYLPFGATASYQTGGYAQLQNPGFTAIYADARASVLLRDVRAGHMIFPNRTVVSTMDFLSPKPPQMSDARFFSGPVWANESGRLGVALLAGEPTACGVLVYGTLRSSDLTSTTTTGGEDPATTSDAASGSDDSPLAAVLGGLAGALALALAALGAFCAFVLCCCAVVCLVVVVALLLLLVVVVVLVLVVLVVAAGVVGVGGVGAVVLMRRDKNDGNWLYDYQPAASPEEVQRRVADTTEYRVIPWAELVFGRKIGEGAYGTVFGGEWQGAAVAIKTVPMSSAEAMADFEHEALMMAKVSHHPHVVQFIGAATEGDKVAMVLRYCGGGSLDGALHKGKLDAAGKCRVLGEIAGALSFLHSIGVVHRDIAARNVLLDDSLSAKLADLGLSRALSDDAVEQTTKSDVGPVRWMAPEALTDRKYSAASDAWSFGVLMWEVWSDGAVPYEGMALASLADVALAVVREGARLKAPETCPPAHSVIMTELMSTSPADRPSLDDIHHRLQET